MDQEVGAMTVCDSSQLQFVFTVKNTLKCVRCMQEKAYLILCSMNGGVGTTVFTPCQFVARRCSEIIPSLSRTATIKYLSSSLAHLYMYLWGIYSRRANIACGLSSS